MNKLNIWLIVDDVNELWLKRAFKKLYGEIKTKYILDHLQLKFQNKPLVQLVNELDSPDIIMVDCGQITLLNNKEEGYRLLHKFAKNHTSSIIVLSSTVKAQAREAMEELTEAIENEVVVDCIGGGEDWYAKYLGEKVLEYYPYE